MNPAVAIGLIVVVSVFVLDRVAFRRRTKTTATKPRRFLSVGGLLGFALFCCYGFLCAGELSGSEELLWKIGYGTLAAVTVSAAGCMMAKGIRQQ